MSYRARVKFSTMNLFLFLASLTVIAPATPCKVKGILSSYGKTHGDDNCRLVGHDQLHGSEDLALGKHSVLLISSGDLHATFHQGSARAHPGAVFGLNLRSSAGRPVRLPMMVFPSDSTGYAGPVRLPMKGFPSGLRFQPHGIHVSNASDQQCIAV